MQVRVFVYIVDTKTELSAFQSESVMDQAFFVNEAVQFILNSYTDDKVKPSSVLIMSVS